MALDFFAGCMGGAAGVVVGHPLDTVKVRLQIQTPDNLKYRGTFHCLSTIVKQESFLGLYKGISSPLVGVAGVNALIFGVYGALRPYVNGSPGNNAIWAHFAAGSISGAVQSFVASPMELVKTRMQLNESSPSAKTPSSWEVLRGIYRKEGGLFRGVFKGWGVTLCREIPGFGTYFATYEALTSKSGQEIGTFGMMMAGGMAGVFSWIVTFPIDVVKTRLQSDISGKYSGAIDCFKKTYAAEGHKAFSRGLVSTILRAFPTNAATFTVVTWIMRWADERNGAGIDDGRQYVEDILRESQERIKDSVTLQLPKYHGAMSLSKSCATMVAKYDLSSRTYFNFYDMVQQTYSSEETGKGNGLIQEKMPEAFSHQNDHSCSPTFTEPRILNRSNSSSNIEYNFIISNNQDSNQKVFGTLSNLNEHTRRITTAEIERSHGTSALPLELATPASHSNQDLKAVFQVLDIPVQIVQAADINANSSTNQRCDQESRGKNVGVGTNYAGYPSSSGTLSLRSIIEGWLLNNNVPGITLCKCSDDNCICSS